jgi:hypothetical protein
MISGAAPKGFIYAESSEQLQAGYRNNFTRPLRNASTRARAYFGRRALHNGESYF